MSGQTVTPEMRSGAINRLREMQADRASLGLEARWANLPAAKRPWVKPEVKVLRLDDAARAAEARS